MLGRDNHPLVMPPLRKDARDGGAVAGRTRKDIEARTGRSVVTRKNHKQLSDRTPKKLKAKTD